MPIIDETVAVVRDDDWQYVRIPLAIDLPASELHLHRETANGPIVLSPIRSINTTRSVESLEKLFALVDEALAAGETFELERDRSPLRDVEL